ncbi:MAG: hypothetical protein IPP48_14785 [Chitinophagaceae bacterium]|nr:hypothetical protein [Chitinophagaceae bacterium]
MYYTTTMSATFEQEKNRKAFIYTAIIIGALLLLAIFVTWQLPESHKQITEDFVEINLGNLDEGFGDVQPLIKGDKAPGFEQAEDNKAEATAPEPQPKETPIDESKDADAIPVPKPVKTTTTPKVPNTQPVVKPSTNTRAVTPAPKPQNQK